MNIAVIIYSVIWAAEEENVWFWRECALDLPKCVYVRASHSWSSLQKKWVQGVLNVSLQTAFPNNVLIGKLMRLK